jgi:hypothetical protein
MTDPSPQPTRQCGRCRKHFDAPADIDPAVLAEWWACSSCRMTLLPDQRQRTAT